RDSAAGRPVPRGGEQPRPARAAHRMAVPADARLCVAGAGPLVRHRDARDARRGGAAVRDGLTRAGPASALRCHTFVTPGSHTRDGLTRTVEREVKTGVT